MSFQQKLFIFYFSDTELPYSSTSHKKITMNKDDVREKFYISFSQFEEGDYESAIEGFKEVFNNQMVFFGPDHKNTIDTKYWLSQSLYILGKYDDAVVGFREVFIRRAKILGICHPDTIDARYCMNVFSYGEDEYDGDDEHDAILEEGNEQSFSSDHSNNSVDCCGDQFRSFISDKTLDLKLYASYEVNLKSRILRINFVSSHLF